MTQLAFNDPVPGQSNNTEEPKIPAALDVIKAWANGNIDSSNLSPNAGITNGQLAPGAGRLQNVSANGSTPVVDGEMLTATVGATVTLPAPVLNATCGIRAGLAVTGANPVIVQATSALIYTKGALGVSSINLGIPGAFIILLADGNNWFAIGGGRDTGWVPMTFGTGVTANSGGYTPAARLQDDIVRLRGTLLNNSGGVIHPSALAWMPASMTPTSTNALILTAACPQLASSTIPLDVIASPPPSLLNSLDWPNASIIDINGLTYSI